MIRVKLYTNENCSLCEDVKADLESLQSIAPHEVIEIDISNDPALHAEYIEKIPVVDIGPYSLKPPIMQGLMQSKHKLRNVCNYFISIEKYHARKPPT